MNDIAGPAEVRYHRYCACCESFKNHACAEVANGWEHHHISRSKAVEDFRVAKPTTEGNCILYFEGSSELLEAASLGAIPDDGKVSQIASQKRSSRAQRKITSLTGDQPADEDQLKLRTGLRSARII